MMLVDSPIHAEADASRRFCGDVRCALVRGRSVLTRAASRAPLKLLTPRTGGIARRVVLSSYGGGLVAGDDVRIRVDVGAGAACILSTQASSKVYRSDGRNCRQVLEAFVADDGLLAILPDPLCCYAGASYTQTQAFELSGSGSLVWLDWMTSGRWARAERWQFHAIGSRTDISIDGRLRLRETLRLSGDTGSAFRMGGFDCYAVLAMIGPRVAHLVDHVAAVVKAQPLTSQPGILASVAAIEGGAVVRLLGPRAEVIQEQLRHLLRPLSEVLQEDPWARKW